MSSYNALGYAYVCLRGYSETFLFIIKFHFWAASVTAPGFPSDAAEKAAKGATVSVLVIIRVGLGATNPSKKLFIHEHVNWTWTLALIQFVTSSQRILSWNSSKCKACENCNYRWEFYHARIRLLYIYCIVIWFRS